MWSRTAVGIHEFNIGDALIVFNFQLFDEFAHSEVPNIDVPIIAGACEDFLTKLVDCGNLIVVNILEKQNRLGLASVPHADASIEAAGNEEVSVI